MKIVRFSSEGRTRYGLLQGNSIKAIAGTPFRSLNQTGETFRLKDARLLAPCRPSKIVAIGVNYRSHALEMGSKLPSNPLIFLKPPTCVIGPEDDIVYPPASKQVDYEGELGVVISRRAHLVAPEVAGDYILGYTCFNDVTARDLQNSDGQWTRSKGFDTFGPMGPCIETRLDDSSVDIETYVNGKMVQKGNTSDLVFGVAALLSFASQVMTLMPGDVIATGTPGGIGPVQPGDEVEVRIKEIGSLRNHIVRHSNQ
jgi:2-keto-4-pentenoate hydratase/2-oxohepta-3-ene-1,7-dioic acid hydratase in catechol pathway